MKLHRALLVCAAPFVLTCSPVARDLGNLACDNSGACAAGYSCDSDANVCVTTGDACPNEGRTSACPSNLVRECTGGRWSDCTPYGGECTPGTTICSANNLVVCNGRGYVEQNTPCGAGCNAVAQPQRCNECVPSGTTCVGLVFVTCSADGLILSQQNCDTGSDCAGAGQCDPSGGCSLVNEAPDDTPCDEGAGQNNNMCDSWCQNGVCETTTAVTCNDGFECTTDTCDVVIGCVYMPQPLDTPCRGSNGSFCDSTCDGATTCRNAGFPVSCDDTNPCTVDSCNNGDGSCASVAGNGGAECRPVAGDCDVAEACTGLDTSCPIDGFLDNTILCRPALDAVCDILETCTGLARNCPPDQVATSTTPCGDTLTDNTCTNPDHCDGNGACGRYDAVNGTGCSDCSAGPGACDPGGCQGGACPDRCDGLASAPTCNSTADCGACRECYQLTCSGGTPPSGVEHQACADTSDGSNWGAGRPCEAVACLSEGTAAGDATAEAVGGDCYAGVASGNTATVTIRYTFNTASASGTPFNLWMRNAIDSSWDANGDAGDEWYACTLTGVDGGTTYVFSFFEADLNAGRHGPGCSTFPGGGASAYCWMAADGDTNATNGSQTLLLDEGNHTLDCTIIVNSNSGSGEDAGFDGIIFTTDTGFIPAENVGPTACADSDATFTAGTCTDGGNNWGPNLAPSPGTPDHCGIGAPMADGTACSAGVCCAGACQGSCP